METRTARRTAGNGNLEAAMAMLMKNQAQFLAHLSESRREFAEFRKDIGRIEKELDTIKAVLVRHETMLEKLPEAIREKIGFKAI
jgi:septal ring factor EnvC (AmiA/AmiB activator)